MAMSFLGFGITMAVIDYSRKAAGFYTSIRSLVDGYSARELSHAGLEAGLLTLRALPEKDLFTLGIVSNPPKLLLSEHCDDSGKCIKYYISYSIQPEDGKLNLNYLVKSDELDNNVYLIFSRLFDALDMDVDSLGAVVDWIDENDFRSTGGAEKDDYASLSPPRKIKNGPLYSLSELSAIIGFNHRLIYSARVPADFEKEQKERASLGASEEQLLQAEDWVFANNVTAYLPSSLRDKDTEKVNLNIAPYHVLHSLSEAMGREEIGALFKLRNSKGYITEKKDVEDLPEMQRPGTVNRGIGLGKELFGTGISGFLKLDSRFYRITGVGFISVGADTEEKSLAVRRVWGIWDKLRKELIYYAED